MKAKTGKNREIEGGKPCPKCGQNMQRLKHGEAWKPRPGRYHFRYWDRCEPCRHLQHYEAAKVEPADVHPRAVEVAIWGDTP